MPNAHFIWSSSIALIAGLTGSLHCLGMCGPMRILASSGSRGGISFQSGRVFAYLILGAIAGKMGSYFPIWLFPVVFLGIALLGMSLRKVPSAFSIGAFRRIASAHPFFLGLGSAALPCGMLHAWLLAALGSGSAINGMLILTALWLGSLPALELASGALKAPLLRLRDRFPRALPLILVALALVPIGVRIAASVFSEKQSCHHNLTKQVSLNHDACHSGLSRHAAAPCLAH